MAEYSLEERLQPSLLDRLVDDDRKRLEVVVRPRAGALAAHAISTPELIGALSRQGLELIEAQVAETGSAASRDEIHRFSVGTQTGVLTRIREIRLRAGDGSEVPLESIAEVSSQFVDNLAAESPERRTISMRQLRDAVYRDLIWLLNSNNLDSSEDLSRFPEVESSVLNFGMPSFAGRIAGSIDPSSAAQQIKRAIETFEPRLSNVRVTPEEGERSGPDESALLIRIEADLWGHPGPQHLILRSRIDSGSGEVSLTNRTG